MELRQHHGANVRLMRIRQKLVVAHHRIARRLRSKYKRAVEDSGAGQPRKIFGHAAWTSKCMQLRARWRSGQLAEARRVSLNKL